MQDLHETMIKAYTDTQHIHRRKFLRLRSELLKSHSFSPQYKFDAVLNLSTRQFTHDELRILSLGFNFCPSLPHFPTQDYILATEAHIKLFKLSPENAALLRNAIVNELERDSLKDDIQITSM
jgi:hypothetical protein